MGRPRGSGRDGKKLLEHLLSRTAISEAGCREVLTQKGRPYCTYHGKSVPQARVVFKLAKGYWPENCLHTCDNCRCIEPLHLYDGTPKDNSRDLSVRDRQPLRKVTYAQQLLIWKDARPHRDIAAEYGINRSRVTAIKRKFNG